MILASVLLAFGLFLQLTEHRDKAWALVPLFAFFGPVFEVVSGVSIVGRDLAVVLVAALFARRVRLPARMVAAACVYLLAAMTVAFVGGASPTFLFGSLLVVIASIFGGLGGYRSVMTDDMCRKWFLTGCIVFLAGTVLLLMGVYRGLGFVPLSAPYSIKDSLVLSYGGSNYIAAIAVLIAGASVHLSRWGGVARNAWSITTFVLALTVVVLTFSKWGIASFVAVVAVTGFTAVMRRSAQRRRKGLILVVAILLLAAARLIREGGVFSVISETGLSISSYQTGVSRMDIWSLYFSAFKSNPFFGRGLGWTTSYNGEAFLAHNSFLEFLGQGGILLLGAFILYATVLVLQRAKGTAGTTLPLLTAALVCGLLEPTLLTGWFDLIFFVALGMAADPSGNPSQAAKGLGATEGLSELRARQVTGRRRARGVT